jgi:hypothetical protein
MLVKTLLFTQPFLVSCHTSQYSALFPGLTELNWAWESLGAYIACKAIWLVSKIDLSNFFKLFSSKHIHIVYTKMSYASSYLWCVTRSSFCPDFYLYICNHTHTLKRWHSQVMSWHGESLESSKIVEVLIVWQGFSFYLRKVQRGIMDLPPRPECFLWRTVPLVSDLVSIYMTTIWEVRVCVVAIRLWTKDPFWSPPHRQIRGIQEAGFVSLWKIRTNSIHSGSGSGRVERIQTPPKSQILLQVLRTIFLMVFYKRVGSWVPWIAWTSRQMRWEWVSGALYMNSCKTVYQKAEGSGFLSYALFMCFKQQTTRMNTFLWIRN